MWTVIYMTQSMEDAKNLKMMFENNGISTRLRTANENDVENDVKNNVASDIKQSCEVLVSKEYIEQAHSLIIENGY